MYVILNNKKYNLVYIKTKYSFNRDEIDFDIKHISNSDDKICNIYLKFKNNVLTQFNNEIIKYKICYICIGDHNFAVEYTNGTTHFIFNEKKLGLTFKFIEFISKQQKMNLLLSI